MERRVRTVMEYLRAYRVRVLLGVLFVALNAAFNVALPFVLRYAFDDLNAGVRVWRTYLGYAGAYAGLGICAALAGLAMRRFLLGMSNLAEADLRRDVFTNLTRLDPAFYHSMRTGDIMTRMTADLGSVREMLGQGSFQGARAVFGALFAYSAMFAIDWPLALAVLAPLPFVSIGFYAVNRRVRKYYDASQEQFSTISNFAQETFSGFRTVKGFGIEDRWRGLFRSLNEEYIRRSLRLSKIDAAVWPFLALAFSVEVAVVMGFGGHRATSGAISLGTLVQFLNYLIFLQWPMVALGWVTNLIVRGRASFDRLRGLLDANPVVQDNGAKAVPAAVDLRFENITLRRDGCTLLDGIDLTIPPGGSLGITGPTGAGKTLLISLLARLMDPDEGRVTIGGVDVRDLPLADLRRLIGVAPQEPFLFSDTLANNIGFGTNDAKDELIHWAADIAHLGGDVAGFPDKFETRLGERGVTLSGGQRQRTALSRAIARKPAILVLDDVFSAVDTQTEAQIIANLVPLLAGRISIVISHRVSALRHTDRIVVLEAGRIAQSGTHDELVARPGYYRELDEQQRLAARLEAS